MVVIGRHVHIDPVSLERVRVSFPVVRGDSKHVYDANHLLDYIEKTGDLADPLTRQLFTSLDLTRLQRTTGKMMKNLVDLQTAREEEQTRQSLISNLLDELLTCHVEEDVLAPILDLRAVANQDELMLIQRVLHSAGHTHIRFDTV